MKKRTLEMYIKTWYLKPLSNSFKKKLQAVLDSNTRVYANLKNNNSNSGYGLKENVLCKDGSVIDLWLVDMDILTKIHRDGYLEGYKVWCSRGGSRVEDVTKNIDVFIAPKIDTIPWIRTPQKNSRLLVFK